MGRELRKHPRVPANLPCSLRYAGDTDAVRASAFSVASHGLGVHLDADHSSSLAVGTTVTIVLELEANRALVMGTIAWMQRAPNRSCSIGVRLRSQAAGDVHPYEAWVARRYSVLRRESFELGGTLAADRMISLRALQRALDNQARDGGYLCDHLSDASAG